MPFLLYALIAVIVALIFAYVAKAIIAVLPVEAKYKPALFAVVSAALALWVIGFIFGFEGWPLFGLPRHRW